MNKLGTLALLLVATLLLGLAACGDDDDDGGDDITPVAEDTDDATDDVGDDDDEGDAPIGGIDLEGYFATMEDIATRTDDELEAISEDLVNTTFESDVEEIEATRNGLQQTGEVLELATLEVAEIDPPDEVTDEHGEFLSALQNVTALSSDLYSDLDGVTTIPDAEEVLGGYDDDLQTADDTFDEACLALQAIADDNSIDRDLQCGDD
jgi:hypothetical protein